MGSRQIAVRRSGAGASPPPGCRYARVDQLGLWARVWQRRGLDCSGVVVECVQSGGSLRVRVVSPGFDPTWRVQFPKDIRRAGARYVVTEIRPSAQGGFYRARGEIKRLL